MTSMKMFRVIELLCNGFSAKHIVYILMISTWKALLFILINKLLSGGESIEKGIGSSTSAGYGTGPSCMC